MTIELNIATIVYIASVIGVLGAAVKILAEAKKEEYVDPSRVGYEFMGWSDTGVVRTKYTRDSIKLYNDTSFTVAYNLSILCPIDAIVYSSTAGTIDVNVENLETEKRQ